MKVDAKIKLKNSTKAPKISSEMLAVPVDLDYVGDYDDLIESVESELYRNYGVTLCNEIDFTIENAPELCAEIIS